MEPLHHGILVQDIRKGDMEGYNDTNEQPDRAAAESAVQVVADLYARMKWRGRATQAG